MEVNNAQEVHGVRLGRIRHDVPKKPDHAHQSHDIHARKLPSTAMGPLASSVSKMSPEGRESFRAFMVEAKEAVRDGSFSVESFAEKAPDELKDVLNSRQVSVEDALEPLAQRATRFRRPLDYGQVARNPVPAVEPDILEKLSESPEAPVTEDILTEDE